MVTTINQATLDILLGHIIFGAEPPPGTAANDPSGIRNVDGTFNNILADGGGTLLHSNYGVTDQPFERLTTAQFMNGSALDGFTLPGFGPTLFGDNYAQNLNVYDASPRTISNLIANMETQPPGTGIGNTPADPLGNPFNAWFTTFGQFFDHGLDFVNKGGNGLIIIPILPGDPLYDPTPGALNMMFQSRATLVGTETINSTAPLIDQNQTYGSHQATKFWLTEVDAAGEATGHLVTGADGGMATWADVKENSQRLFDAGVTTFVLDDSDIGNLRDPVTGLPTGQKFLADIAHTADPSGKTADADTVLGNTPGAGEYDDELLDAHYVAGDGRVNENTALMAVHQTFHAEHNRLVDEIKQLIAERDVIEPGYAAQWTGSMIFEAAKVANEMQYQHLVFEEFARRISPNIAEFSEYDVNLNPNIMGEFAHAVYRLGHSMITEGIDRVDIAGNAASETLIEAFLNPLMFGDIGAADIATGMSRLEGNEIDEFVVNGVRNFLVGLPLDLAALNIARGRDTGVGTLNQVRADLFSQTGDLSLAAYESWEDFGNNLLNQSSLVNFIAAYSRDSAIAAARNANNLALARSLAQDKIDNDAAFMGVGGDQGFWDIDLWIGGLAEAKVLNGLLGSTFDFIFAQQMLRLQNGDRFYYLGRDIGSIIDGIESQSFADLVMRGTGAHHVNGNIFSTADEYIELAQQPSSLIDNESEVIGGTNANNTINALGGNDTVYGEAGNDVINGGAGNDFIYGGKGNDTINDTSGDDRMMGGDGNDNMTGGVGLDMLAGENGNDTLNGGADDDSILGGAGNDTMIGGAGDDEMAGGEDDDTIDGGIGDDEMLGDEGHDSLIGGAGFDRMDGGDGNDTLIGGGGGDKMSGGVTGHDIASYQTATSGVTVNLTNADLNTGDALADQYLSIEEFWGSNFNDTMIGDIANNVFRGLNGADSMNGDAGEDILEGGAGNDVIDGGLGSDIAVFSGNFSGYTLTAGIGGAITVSGADGTDTVVNVEALQFADQIVNPATGQTLPLVTLTNKVSGLAENTVIPVGVNPGVKVADIVVSDPDGAGVPTFSLSGEDAGLFLIRVVGGVRGLYFTGPALNFEAKRAYDVTVNVNDAAQGPAIDSFANFTLNVTDVNDTRAVITSHGHNNVLENTNKNIAVYYTEVRDLDSVGSHTYTLTGVDAGLFTIDSFGEIRFNDSPDFENPLDDDGDNVYELNVNVSDGVGPVSTKAIEIRVRNDIDTDVEFASPTGSATVAENTNGVVFDADAFGGGTIAYSLTGADAARFTINAANGKVSWASPPNFENPLDAGNNNVYNINVVASDGSTSDSQAVTITVTDVNEFAVSAPADGDGAANAVNENAAIGTTVNLDANATDADGSNNTVTYALTSNPGGLFQINSSTGVVTTAAAINRESVGPSVDVEVTATSSDGSSKASTFTIDIGDVDEFNTGPITDSDGAANFVMENSAAGMLVGVTAFASDADATNNGITYDLLDDAGGAFAIDSMTGVVTVAGAVNREAAGANESIQVRATSEDGSVSVQTFVISIGDQDEFDVSAPADADNTNNLVSENAAAGTLVGLTAFSTDADATTNAVTYALTSNPGGLFQINSTTGVVSVAGGIDREALGSSVDIEVTATGADGSTNATTFTINIADVDEFDVNPPVDNDPATNEASENASAGTVVGVMAFASDDDATNNTVTYSLTNNAGNRFAIDASTGVVTVIGGLDFEALASHLITVRADSSDGSFATKDFTVGILDFSPVINDANGNAAGVVIGGVENEQLFGLGGNDILAGGANADVLNGGTGTDLASYHTSTSGMTFDFNNMAGNTGDAAGDTYVSIERFRFTNFADNVIGDGAANYINGMAGDDTLDGGGGNDTLVGSTGDDVMIGGLGNDIFYVENQNDETIEAAGEGIDRVVATANYVLHAGQSIEQIQANTGVAPINVTGNEIANTVTGNGGNNVLDGGASDDTIRGGDGVDRLIGGLGVDNLQGDAGSDTFVLTNVQTSRDRIVDFLSGTDVLEVDAALFGGGLTAGPLSSSQFVVNATGLAGDADDRFIYNSNSGFLYYDADGNGAGARQAIAIFNSAVTVAFGDFDIV